MRSLIDGVKVASVCQGSSKSLLGAPRELGGHVTPRRDEILLPARQLLCLGYGCAGCARAEGLGCPAHCCSATELPHFRAVGVRFLRLGHPRAHPGQTPKFLPRPCGPSGHQMGRTTWLDAAAPQHRAGGFWWVLDNTPPAQLCPTPLR